MPKTLNFEALEEHRDAKQFPKESRRGRWPSREENKTVQMSLRTSAAIYDDFRELCEEERRTNGEMLEEMLKVYRELKKLGAPERRSASETLYQMKEDRLRTLGAEKA